MVLEVLILDLTLIVCEDTLLGMIKITTLTIAPQGTALTDPVTLLRRVGVGAAIPEI